MSTSYPPNYIIFFVLYFSIHKTFNEVRAQSRVYNRSNICQWEQNPFNSNTQVVCTSPCLRIHLNQMYGSLLQPCDSQIMIHWCIEKMIQYWELEVEIQTLMKGHLCYTTRDNAELTLPHAISVVSVSKQTHQPCIHKYCDFHYWWTAVTWYSTYQEKSNQLLKKLVNMSLCSVKRLVIFDKPRTSEVY